LPADWWGLSVAGVTLVSHFYRSCRGGVAFGKAAVGGVLSSLPAAGAAGPSAEAGPSDLTSWRFLGRQPADGSALGLPG
jgi:hypothetical protein